MDAMAHELSIWRATVRQVLNTLVNEELLVRNPATRVLEVTSLDANDISEIYRARKVLELAKWRPRAMQTPANWQNPSAPWTECGTLWRRQTNTSPPMAWPSTRNSADSFRTA